MVALVRTCEILATKDGVVLKSTAKLDHNETFCLSYGSSDITNLAVARDARTHGLQAYGIVGLLELGSASNLIAITGREEVASIGHRSIYVITQVTLIPLNSESAAQKALDIAAAQSQAVRASGYATDESDHVADDGDTPSKAEQRQDRKDAAALEPAKDSKSSESNATTKTAGQDNGTFDRFAQRWFMQKRPQADSSGQKHKDSVEKTSEDDLQQAAAASPDLAGQAQSELASSEAKPSKSTIDTYSKRIVRTVRLYLTSRSFFFSYDYDLSRSFPKQHTQGQGDWHKHFVSDVFWNRHLLAPLIEAGASAYALPLVQGFVGQRTFSIPRAKPEEKTSEQAQFQLALISRRSIGRAGLRYLRRGVNEQGHVANHVETEHILTPAHPGPNTRSFSLLQLRGSIPIFFSQSPYSLKPLPQMYGSEEQNDAAFRKHFGHLTQLYGEVQAVSLIDKHGSEATIGKQYERAAAQLNEKNGIDGKQIAFNWFDFHHECRGMRFENVSILISGLEESLRKFSWSTMQDLAVTSSQKGIVRTNCMDCLDRTNVTQSAISGWALQQQLAELNLRIDLQADKQSIWFNQLWADNGDAISKQYAGTAALKGDFTRTRKRNWTGALTDFSLTLNRYYNNIFGDYFLQTCIDYLLGNVGPDIFDSFEAEMTIQDHALDVNRIRQNAIDVCAKIVLEEPQMLEHGWSLSCPASANTLRSMPFEDCVLLMTSEALYFCRFDWKVDKVGSFERIELVDVDEIWRGAYVTSALGAAQTDENRNAGFVVRYRPTGRALIRTNTRTVDNEKAVSKAGEMGHVSEDQADTRLLAFKIPAGGQAQQPASERETCQQISDAIATASTKLRSQAAEDNVLKVQERSIISAEEAQKSTGYIESIGYSLKKLIW